MNASQAGLWTIDELGARTAEALAVDYAGPPNDRVRDVPDRRTIRYYTTLGLIDRPAEMRGRTAYYGARHLRQLVAIKRLQAQGLSLAEVQRRLYGLPDPELARLARLPEGTQAPGQPGARRAERAAGFWKSAPAEVHPAETSTRDEEGTKAGIQALQGIRLGDDATVLIALKRPADEEDVEAIRKAAEPLMRLLKKRRLLGSHEDGEGQSEGERERGKR